MVTQLQSYNIEGDTYIKTLTRPVINLINLTDREHEVLQHICEGHSMNEVADILHLSTSTIISHKRKLFQKFGINNLVRLGVLAERYGFLRSFR